MSDKVRVTSRSETPFFFPVGGETLFGILTRPLREPSDTVAVLLRGAAQGPSSGRNQASARMCRRLAERGIPAVRFDYRGVGDSTGAVDRFRLDQPFEDDLKGAIGWLQEQGMNRFALVGTCFGARTALASAPTLPGLEALVMIAPPVRDKEKGDFGTRALEPDRSVVHYARRAMRPRVVRGLLNRDRRRAYAHLARGAWRARGSADGAPRQISAAFRSAFEGVLQRRIPVLFVCGTGDPAFPEFDRALSGELGDILRGASSRVDVEILDGRVGAFADADLQDPVIELITGWLARLSGTEVLDTKEQIHVADSR